MITEVTQYVGEISIRFAATQADSTTVLNRFEWVEKRILRSLLGDDLYLTFIENIEQTSGKYYDLKNGVTSYTNTDGRKDVFDGVKDMLKYFVYYYYQTYSQNQASTLGDFKNNIENSERQDKALINKMAVDAYNIGIQKYYETYCYMSYKNGQESDYYPNWRFGYLNKINQFGI